ncbi:MAG: hypothetical protein JW891_03100 [Candidatus Lokiarchaeota archaeon]|nr:hypothetical protein [Candidatus Lokiarchaeota archaeon]
MEKKDSEKIQSLIAQIEQLDENLASYTHDLSLSTRSDLLFDIILDAISKNELFTQLNIPIDNLCKDTSEEKSLIHTIIADTITNIKLNPNKKVIYLKEFLAFFTEIADSDKEVLLTSLKDEKIELLKEKMVSLVELFNLKV